MMREKEINIADEFKKHGLKLTHQRLAVYQALLKNKEHPSVDDLYQSIRGDYPMLSRNTIYTTLETLKGLGLITEVNPWHKARFDSNVEVHHHVVCTECKRIDDIQDRDLNDIPIPDSIKGQYSGLSHKVEFFGICPSCFQNQASEKTKKG